MQLTNSLVSICCNNILSDVGGDIYISVMTIVSSVRQLVETPIYAMNEGTLPNFKLQLWCMSSSASAKSYGSDEYYDSWLYSSDVEYYYFIAKCIDWNFQL